MSRNGDAGPGRTEAWAKQAEQAARRGDFGEAARALEAALATAPGDAALLNNLALVLLAAGRPVDAERAAGQAVASAPGHALAWMHLGQARGELGKFSLAAQAYRHAIAREPRLAQAHFGLAAALSREGLWTGALAAFDEARILAPDSADPWIGMATAQLRSGMRREAVASLRNACDADPGRRAELESHALFAMQYGDEFTAKEIFEAHLAWAARHVAQGVPRPRRTGGRARIRVGYVSPAFHASAMAFALLPALANHDRERFEVTCYAQNAGGDDVTARLRELTEHWRPTHGLSDSAMARLVREDGIDVLVDLAGHTPGNRLAVFALRPAPVQAAWLDYFNTTGVRAIDALIADDETLGRPLGQSFVEQLVSAGPVRYCYEPPAYAPPVAPRAAGGERPVTFGSFARLPKICDTTLDAWAGVLREAPGSRLLLKNDALSDPAVRERVAGWFAARGVEPSRLLLRPASAHRDMLAEYLDADIVLDTMPYNGGITTLEALWMGRPVVTLAGGTLVSRQGASLLGAIGMRAWIAEDAGQFVRIACALAADRERLSHLHASLREALAGSVLCDAPAFTRRLEALFEALLAQGAPA